MHKLPSMCMLQCVWLCGRFACCRFVDDSHVAGLLMIRMLPSLWMMRLWPSVEDALVADVYDVWCSPMQVCDILPRWVMIWVVALSCASSDCKYVFKIANVHLSVCVFVYLSVGLFVCLCVCLVCLVCLCVYACLLVSGDVRARI